MAHSNPLGDRKQNKTQDEMEEDGLVPLAWPMCAIKL